MVGYLPGMVVPFQPYSLPGVLIPTCWWNPGLTFVWKWRDHMYKKCKTDTISIIAILSGNHTVITSNIDVARHALQYERGTVIEKPPIPVLSRWGLNVLVATDESWRRHRRILGPSFNSNLYNLVWDQTTELYRNMIDVEGWSSQEIVEVETFHKLTYKLALLVIGKAGFGFDMKWTRGDEAEETEMSLQEAIRISSESVHILSIAKDWMLRLPIPSLQIVRRSQETLRKFMYAKVADRKAEMKSDTSSGVSEENGKDFFSLLIKANEDEGEKLKLTDREVVGNVFIMLLAGHETTAQSIAATLMLLALNPEIQEETLKEIRDVIGDDPNPGFDKFTRLEKVTAAFFEAIRIFPPAYIVNRIMTEDTILHVAKSFDDNDATTPIRISKGTNLVVDFVGISYNPRYFEDPHSYRPSRWYGKTSNPEIFNPFSFGNRSCIGRRFAITETVCFLAMILRDWKVEPIIPDGETEEQWRARANEAYMGISLRCGDAPMRFTKRRLS